MPPVIRMWPRVFFVAGCGIEGPTAIVSKEGLTTATAATVFRGNGQMRPDLAEIAGLKKEGARVRLA
jgi:hypothetical protein